MYTDQSGEGNGKYMETNVLYLIVCVTREEELPLCPQSYIL